MCVIIYSPSGKIPKIHLVNAMANNPDGWGYMAAENGEIVIQKGMTPADFWRVWPRRPKGPVVFHSRIGTHGVRNESNCHPFLLHDGKMAVAHNGIVSRCGTDREWSDTRVFVSEILEKLPENFLMFPVLRELISGYIGNSKLVFMDRAGRVRIINEHLGRWENQMWYSNDSYQRVKIFYQKPFTGVVQWKKSV